mgnify:CR=1 FL=1|jgi:hypothetical protein
MTLDEFVVGALVVTLIPVALVLIVAIIERFKEWK